MNPIDPCSSQSESELFRGHGVSKKKLRAIYDPRPEPDREESADDSSEDNSDKGDKP